MVVIWYTPVYDRVGVCVIPKTKVPGTHGTCLPRTQVPPIFVASKRIKPWKVYGGTSRRYLLLLTITVIFILLYLIDSSVFQFKIKVRTVKKFLTVLSKY